MVEKRNDEHVSLDDPITAREAMDFAERIINRTVDECRKSMVKMANQARIATAITVVVFYILMRFF